MREGESIQEKVYTEQVNDGGTRARHTHPRLPNSLDRLIYFKSAVSLKWFQDMPTVIIFLISHHVLPMLSGVLRDRENIAGLT